MTPVVNRTDEKQLFIEMALWLRDHEGKGQVEARELALEAFGRKYATIAIPWNRIRPALPQPTVPVAPPPSAQAMLLTRVKALTDAGGIGFNEAMERVAREDPDLYERYRQDAATPVGARPIPGR